MISKENTFLRTPESPVPMQVIGNLRTEKYGCNNEFTTISSPLLLLPEGYWNEDFVEPWSDIERGVAFLTSPYNSYNKLSIPAQKKAVEVIQAAEYIVGKVGEAQVALPSRIIFPNIGYTKASITNGIHYYIWESISGSMGMTKRGVTGDRAEFEGISFLVTLRPPQSNNPRSHLVEEAYLKAIDYCDKKNMKKRIK